MPQPDLTPAEVAAYRVMGAFHNLALQCVDLYGADHTVAVLARRNAQRMRYELIVGEDPDQAEVRDIVIAHLVARRERIATLLAP